MLLRAEAEIADALKWTVNAGPAKAAGPKTTKNPDDFILVWTLSGITDKVFEGSVVAQYEKHSIKTPFEVIAMDEAAPPPREE